MPRTPRKIGRQRHDRLRAMRFALWAQRVPLHALTVRQIGGLLDVSESTATRWRRDLIAAFSPIEFDGIPPFITPEPKDKP